MVRKVSVNKGFRGARGSGIKESWDINLILSVAKPTGDYTRFFWLVETVFLGNFTDNLQSPLRDFVRGL